MESASLVFTVLTAFGFLGAFGSVLYKAHKTKSVKHLHIEVFSLFLVAGALIALGSIVGMWNGQIDNVTYGRKAAWIIIGLSMCLPCGYLLKLWILNSKQGKLFRGRMPYQLNDLYSPVMEKGNVGEGSEFSHNVNLGSVKTGI